MCLCCVCCPSARVCTFISAVVTMVEAISISILNLVIILACTCASSPPSYLSADFVRKVYSWFIFSEENCAEKYEGNHYRPPDWILSVPIKFYTSDVYDATKQEANYGYQVTYFILHWLWAISAVPLMCGNTMKWHKLYVPWIVIGIIITLLDTIIGSFYISLMADVNPGWTDGKAIFSMQFLYFRGFVFYIYNILAICIVCGAFWKVYRKNMRRSRTQQEVHREVLVHSQIVINNPAPTQPPPQPYYEQVPLQLAAAPVPGPSNQNPYAMPYQQAHNPNPLPPMEQKPPAPNKYRPFSYTNPSYRPNDPYDVQGMKSNSKAPYEGSAPSAPMAENVHGTSIPRASLNTDEKFYI